jgi:sugar transferase (PEP-CTERM/EpsH1 system associated)
MIAHRIPYPPDKGDKIRSFHEFRYLREQGWRIHLCSFIDDPADIAHVRTLNAQCESSSFFRLRRIPQKTTMLWALLRGRPLTVGAFFKKAALDYIRRVLRDHPIRAVLCFSSPMAEYVLQCPELCDRINTPNPTNSISSANPTGTPTLVMDLIDVDSDKWRQYASQADPFHRFIYQLESKRLAVYETRIASSFDATLAVSDAEALLLRKISGVGSKVYGVPNGVDTDFFRPSPEGPPPAQGRPSCRTLVFCGLMDYPPNVDAVVWFAKEVLSTVRQRLGDVRFRIVGARPSREVEDLRAIPGVEVLGRVEDVRPHVWSADVSIAPIRIARGIQNKVLEAMAMAKPVVATHEAFEGLDAVPGEDLLVTKADSKAFAEAVAGLCTDRDRAARMGRNARKAVLEKYSWENHLKTLNDLLQGKIL